MRPEYRSVVEKAVQSVRKQSSAQPRVGLVLGSGLSSLAQEFEGQDIPFSSIEGYPIPTVTGHSGTLRIGEQTAVMAGRFHFYEGHPMEHVVLPIFLLKALGVETIVLTNAAGGIRHDLVPGDLVLISDHINLLGTNPLIGPNDDSFGPRFPDMSSIYHADLRRIAKEIDPHLKDGVYGAVSGPSYETPAEIRAYRSMGMDVVGMSTVPEAIVARYLGLQVCGISVVTNKASGLGLGELDHSEVVETGKKAEHRLQRLLTELTSTIIQG
jgi:purine-nucleoside phosphorylase